MPYIPAGDGGFLFPYFDGLDYVSVLANQKQVVLHDSHSYLARNSITAIETHDTDSQIGITPEYAGPDSYYCDWCETDGHAEDHITYIQGPGTVCDSCLDYFNRCDECDTWHHQDDTHSSPDGTEMYCSHTCWLEHYASCQECNEQVPNDEIAEGKDGDMLCEDCIENEEEEDTE